MPSLWLANLIRDQEICPCEPLFCVELYRAARRRLNGKCVAKCGVFPTQRVGGCFCYANGGSWCPVCKAVLVHQRDLQLLFVLRLQRSVYGMSTLLTELYLRLILDGGL